MKRFWKRLLLVVLAAGALCGIAAWIVLSWLLTRPPVYFPTIDVGAITLRSWPEHDAIYQQTEFPYVFSFPGDSGAIEYVGAKHTSDAAAPQLTEIERRWDEFKPTVALCEGRSRMYRFASRRKTGTLGESDLTRILANRSGIPLFTLEPPYEAEVAGLLKHFEPRLVATYMTLRVYCAEAGDSGGGQDGLALNLLRKRTSVEGLRATFSTVEELDAFWKEEFPDESDWRKMRDTDRNPRLREVGNISRQVRGEHMVRSLVELARKGERVFAVVGASHVIRQEPVLRRLLEAGDAR